MSPFPTSLAGKQQLFKEIKAHLPEALDMVNTLKIQGITSSIVRYEHGGVIHGDVRELGYQSWHVDDALVERVRVAELKATAVELEAKRVEKKRIESAKRARSKK